MITYVLRRFPTDTPRYFTDPVAGARYWHEECHGMPLRVLGSKGVTGETFGLYSEVRPILEAVAALISQDEDPTAGFTYCLDR